MNAQIDEKGFLSIERGNILKPQGCPFRGSPIDCGDWCPLFGESNHNHVKIVSLQICKTTLYFHELVDKRSNEKI